MEYKSLLQLTLELEGLLTLRMNRSGEKDTDNLAELDDMILAKIAELSRITDSLDIAEESVITAAEEAVETQEAEETQEAAEVADNALEEEEALAEGTPEPAPTATEPVAPSTSPAVPASEPSVQAVEAIGDRQPAESLYDRLARERAANLSKAFSLNDKFRFRRELFRNSQQEMDEAIEALSQMTTADEAAEYIYDDLCLSPDSPDVKDFMDIITKHF